MAVNRGKQFENILREQFEKLPNTATLRLYDVTMGYREINNPCDLIVYRNGVLNLFEAKAINENTLNFKAHIRDNQWNKLLEYSKIPGVNAGIICWFIKQDITLYIPIESLEALKDEGFKSFNCNARNSKLYKDLDVWSYDIQAFKKRVFFDYDLDLFLEEIE